MTLLEEIRLHLDHIGGAQSAINVVLEWCAPRSLGPCVAGNPIYVAGSRYASCDHCTAELLLREIGTAMGVLP